MKHLLLLLLRIGLAALFLFLLFVFLKYEHFLINYNKPVTCEVISCLTEQDYLLRNIEDNSKYTLHINMNNIGEDTYKVGHRLQCLVFSTYAIIPDLVRIIGIFVLDIFCLVVIVLLGFCSLFVEDERGVVQK